METTTFTLTLGPLAAGARNFAIAAHGEQKYGDKPYSYHLDQVAAILEPFGDEAVAAGYLHDVVEDTATSLVEILTEFSADVACAVSICTDAAGINRRARKLATNLLLAELKAYRSHHRLGLIVKAADRLANLRESVQDGGKLSMYRREHAAFRAAAYRPGLCDGLWEEMDEIVDGRDE